MCVCVWSFDNPRMLRHRSLETLLQMVQVGPRAPVVRRSRGSMCGRGENHGSWPVGLVLSIHSFVRSFILLKKKEQVKTESLLLCHITKAKLSN